MSDKDIHAVEVAVGNIEAHGPHGPHLAALHSAVAAALIHGKPIRDIACAAHLTALEVLDAADALTYPGHAFPPQEQTECALSPQLPGNRSDQGTPAPWRAPRNGDRTRVSHRPSPYSPALRYWLTYRAVTGTHEREEHEPSPREPGSDEAPAMQQKPS